MAIDYLKIYWKLIRFFKQVFVCILRYWHAKDKSKKKKQSVGQNENIKYSKNI